MKLYFRVFILVLIVFSFSISIGQIDFTLFEQKAPKTFKAKFTTPKGEFVIKAYRKWSPLGVVLSTSAAFFTDWEVRIG